MPRRFILNNSPHARPYQKPWIYLKIQDMCPYHHLCLGKSGELFLEADLQ